MYATKASVKVLLHMDEKQSKYIGHRTILYGSNQYNIILHSVAMLADLDQDIGPSMR